MPFSTPASTGDEPTAWTPTRAAGLDRLAAFVPRAGSAYTRRRNHDEGPGARTAVSTLSPWIRHRLLSETEVLAAVLARHSADAADKFVQEVCWRTYWKGWLELRPAVWADYEQAVRDAFDTLERDAGTRERFDAAVAGRTGLECFDAWVGELLATGYLLRTGLEIIRAIVGPEKPGYKAQCAGNSGSIAKRCNAVDGLFGANPKGRRLFSHISALLVAH